MQGDPEPSHPLKCVLRLVAVAAVLPGCLVPLACPLGAVGVHLKGFVAPLKRIWGWYKAGLELILIRTTSPLDSITPGLSRCCCGVLTLETLVLPTSCQGSAVSRWFSSGVKYFGRLYYPHPCTPAATQHLARRSPEELSTRPHGLHAWRWGALGIQVQRPALYDQAPIKEPLFISIGA